MACPFLKEGRARYCHAAPVRKLILERPGVTGGGRCASPDHRQCELLPPATSGMDCCPYLEEVGVQYCGASPSTKLVPVTDGHYSSCSGGSYRYCDSYLAEARQHAADGSASPQFYFAPNHFWLDPEESGLCHIGIDSFLLDTAGSIEAVTYATLDGTDCPALVLTIHGVEWPMSFPNPMMIQKVNGRVRSDPARLAADPYGAGWLFEGRELPGRTRARLMTGKPAVTWQAKERERLVRELQEMSAPACDGGMPVHGVAGVLPRPQFVYLFQHFFANRGWAVEE